MRISVFEIENGKIVKATSNDNASHQRICWIPMKVLDTSANSPLESIHIFCEPMKDTLFDEKICGSFHLTPGSCPTKMHANGNKSAVHWDLVMIQRAGIRRWRDLLRRCADPQRRDLHSAGACLPQSGKLKIVLLLPSIIVRPAVFLVFPFCSFLLEVSLVEHSRVTAYRLCIRFQNHRICTGSPMLFCGLRRLCSDL